MFSFKSSDEWFDSYDTEDLQIIYKLKDTMMGQKDYSGMSLLFSILWFSKSLDFQRKAIKLLVECPDELCNGMTKPMVLSFLGEVEQLKFLSLQELIKTDDDGNTLMHYAAAGSQTKVIDILPPQLFCMKNSKNQTSLYIAAQKQNLETFAALLPKEQGVELECWKTVLWYLIWSQEATSKTKLLVRMACQYQKELSTGMTTEMVLAYLDDIASLQSVDFDKLMKKDSYGNDIFNYALHGGAEHVLKQLLRCNISFSIFVENMQPISPVGSMTAQIAKMLLAAHSGQHGWNRQTILMYSIQNERIQKYFRVTDASMRNIYDQNASCQFIAKQKYSYQLALKLDKTLGWLYDGNSALECIVDGERVSQAVKNQILKNPLCVKEIQLAKKLFAKLQGQSKIIRIQKQEYSKMQVQGIPKNLDWFYRQIQFENVYNKSILEEIASAQYCNHTALAWRLAKRAFTIHSQIETCRLLYNNAKLIIKNFLRQL